MQREFDEITINPTFTPRKSRLGIGPGQGQGTLTTYIIHIANLFHVGE